MISVLRYKIYLKMTSYWSWWWEVNNEQDELARTILTISVLALLFLWYKWMLSYTTKGKTSLPPGPSGLPIVGYLPFLGSNLHERFTEMAHKYGPIFSLRLGSKLHVVVNSMDLVKVVARDLDQTFVNRNTPIVASVITYGEADITFANSKTAQWRNMRKILVSQVMSNASLKASQIFRTREVKKMVHEVYTKIGKKVNINEIAFNTQFSVVTSILWGCSKSDEGMGSSHIGDGFHEVEMKIVELLGAPNISDLFPWLSWFDLQKRRRDMQRQLEYIDQMFDNIIEERIKANSSKIDGAVEEDGRKDFLQILLELKDQKDTPVSFDMIQIKSQLMDVIVAANDTTSTMVEWVMAEILNNPVVMRKVQDELTEVIGINNIVEESYLHKLTYLDAVIKETFRLHPPLPLLIQKSPDESCKVGGYTIPKDTTLHINVWAIHHDPNNWINPLEFKPERFLNGKWDYNGNDMKFLSFGTGRRICPGIPLGDKMLTYMLASLLHSFEWNLPKDEEFEVNDEFGFVTKKKKSLVAIPSQRLSDKTLYMG
ncbi:putative cytochrome P450 [Helianthus annuus]|uniref:Cytochrome P450 n=1 Tax=Helianthus annuus TaxID=4232 RepID=A0A251VAB9_HELAN|nr:cytochrome P450 76C1 [Helianthus annuus]KAF5816204.1 putative cytochrome P450 [Helianthus annuus]KAJ0594535.1 putative cytochrome P450 [Helianthus annuus]KAJ0602752.1 putative cytochrome P450 [Helianthus annuus]KAJ0769621.1 putative cytochrome P450 [Helianthus annuus]KAJ0937519.1 putative cytochrome P450 [Helianthus annuus]